MKLLKLGSIVALCAAPLIATAQGIELTLGHVGEPGSLIGAAADEFAMNANAKLAGKVKITV
ncbi:MAG: TRAP transporter substrate-binding protein, partial [Burkholderiales bacterium]|nr:TRAP transporter substrate-binding protein [Burkholderiales bacterium]